jgi:hypothetical protein
VKEMRQLSTKNEPTKPKFKIQGLKTSKNFGKIKIECAEEAGMYLNLLEELCSSNFGREKRCVIIYPAL